MWTQLWETTAWTITLASTPHSMCLRPERRNGGPAQLTGGRQCVNERAGVGICPGGWRLAMSQLGVWSLQILRKGWLAENSEPPEGRSTPLSKVVPILSAPRGAVDGLDNWDTFLLPWWGWGKETSSYTCLRLEDQPAGPLLGSGQKSSSLHLARTPISNKIPNQKVLISTPINKQVKR